MRITKSDIERLRDPFVLLENGVYYMYGSLMPKEGWENTEYACYVSNGDLEHWTRSEGQLYEVPKNAVKNFWAPEVHKFNGKFYMFATYFSSQTNHKVCTILESESPLGPFKEISDTNITPSDWDCIDGTFYADEEGNPWMIFVREWISTNDKVGRMAAARLSEDLTHFVSEPIELFRADDPVWNPHEVTDGCFMYKTKDGHLLMLWSNVDDFGYCVAVARSENGKPDGKWIHDRKQLFSKGMHGEKDGGHGMIFTALDGKKYLAIHSPNTPPKETPVFVEIKEEDGTLVCCE